ncbi:uncharacterized protein LOC117124189 [Anneissia japonica]|uniref:uncharacterized protein LOC117124189 n=1 Tax=Anneissia japonica TaxID=1529436 RepID=UPI0014258473|nr:uncharacterized protein LOC117124189 [Anneissia japonica]
MASNKNNLDSVLVYGVKLENRLNIQDLQQLKSAFMTFGDGYNDRLSVDKDEFCILLQQVLTKGSYEEHCDLFDKIDVTKEGKVDWDKIASHLLLEYVEKDDRVKATQVNVIMYEISFKRYAILLGPQHMVSSRIFV